jgi:hypothetical protein
VRIEYGYRSPGGGLVAISGTREDAEARVREIVFQGDDRKVEVELVKIVVVETYRRTGTYCGVMEPAGRLDRGRCYYCGSAACTGTDEHLQDGERDAES